MANPIQVEVTTRPAVEAVVRDLERRRAMLVGKKIGEGIPLYHKKASILLDRWVQKNFKALGGLLKTGKWKPFARGGRWRRGFGLDTSAKLLQDTGLLRASHQPFWNKRDAGVGTTLKYSKHHNEGSGNLPVRRTVPKEAEANEVLMKLLNQHVARAAK